MFNNYVSYTEINDTINSYINHLKNDPSVINAYAAATGGLQALLVQALLSHPDEKAVREVLRLMKR